MQPYALQHGEGWTYRYDIDFTVKAGEMSPSRGAAFVEFVTRKGEEPPDHTHPTEDEVFYVLEGDLSFHCGDEVFNVGVGGFVYLPKGIQHGYTIRSDGDVRLLAVTFPTEIVPEKGWNGFVADIERDGTLIASPSA